MIVVSDSDEVLAVELVMVGEDPGPLPSELPRPGFGAAIVVSLFAVVIGCEGGEVDVSLKLDVGNVDVGVGGVVEVGVVGIVGVVSVVVVSVKGKSVRKKNQ